MASSHKPTGFPRGRPRKDEIRPPTPGAIYQAKLRAKRKKDKNWLAIQAMYQQFWHLANPGKAKEYRKKSKQREVHWEQARINGGVPIKVKFKP